jgi:hypothetical protein
MRRTLGVLAVGVLVGSTACGYHAAYGGTRPATRLTVTAAPSRAPESGALAAVLEGLRGELSRAGVLGPGSGYPRVVVELVRIDERGTAQSLTPQPNGGVELPAASGALVGVTARAWVETTPSRVERDTGDVRRTSAFGSASDPGLDAARREAALNAAGHETGEAIGRRVMGEIEVAQEPM